MLEKISITELLNTPSYYDFTNLWYDWFCNDRFLQSKGKRLVEKIRQISPDNTKFNPDKCYAFFENICPGVGNLFDEIRIFDLETEKILYSVVPSSGHEIWKGKAQIWGRENDFNEPLLTTSWKEVIKWFHS